MKKQLASILITNFNKDKYLNYTIKSCLAQNYKKKGYRIILVDSLDRKDDFYLLFKKLYQIGYSRILIETGLHKSKIFIT